MLSRRGLCSRPTYRGRERLACVINEICIGAYTALGATPHVRALSLTLMVLLRGFASASEERARVRMETTENISGDDRGAVRSDVVMLDIKNVGRLL